MLVNVETFIWIIVAVILGVAELFTGTLVLAMVAGGAALAAVAAALGLPFWVQVIALGGGSIAALWGLRPFLKQVLSSDSSSLSHPIGTKAIEGSDAVVLEKVDGSGDWWRSPATTGPPTRWSPTRSWNPVIVQQW
ncbi:hypothetical protein GCM10029992_42210 [Glycomyces albus]